MRIYYNNAVHVCTHSRSCKAIERQKGFIFMIVDLVNVSYNDIEVSATRSVEETGSLIVYLQNNGDKNHFWSNDKFSSIIGEDIDD